MKSPTVAAIGPIAPTRREAVRSFTTITFTQHEVGAYYRERLPKLSQRGRQWRGTCPLHNGKRRSFSVKAETGYWMCFADCGRGGSMIDFEMTLTGADFRTALADVYAIVGRPTPGRTRMTREQRRAALRASENEQLEANEAGYFARASLLMLEGELERLPSDSSERGLWTHILGSLCADPVAIYRIFKSKDEATARALVRAGREHERTLQLKLLGIIQGMAQRATTDAS